MSNEFAAERHYIRANEALELCARIQRNLEARLHEADNCTINWGHVNDVAAAAQHLREIAEFLNA